jgi:hypothetical protein
MKTIVSIALGLFTCFCLLLASERQALAYVDPGSGLLALQSIASVAAAAGYFLRKRIALLFGSKKEVRKPVMPITAKERNAA